MGTKYPGKPTEVRALDAFITLTRAANSVTSALVKRKAYGELTISQFGVLEALMHLGPLSQRDLAKKLLRSTGNLVTVIDNLERQGAVERRRRTTDRRVVDIHLTEAGRETIEALMPGHVASICEVMSALTPEEQRELRRLCRALGTSL